MGKKIYSVLKVEQAQGEILFSLIRKAKGLDSSY